jgi:hypothetical protein
MSLFQRLSEGKGVKLFKLAPWPIDIWLQPEACWEPFTCRLTPLEVLLPGAGFDTVTAKLPPDATLPVAVSCVAETKVVVSAVPPRRTWALDTNLLPVTVREKLPVPMLAGLMPISAGVGFMSVTALEPLAELDAELVALIVTVLGLGRDAGAV